MFSVSPSVETTPTTLTVIFVSVTLMEDDIKPRKIGTELGRSHEEHGWSCVIAAGQTHLATVRAWLSSRMRA